MFIQSVNTCTDEPLISLIKTWFNGPTQLLISVCSRVKENIAFFDIFNNVMEYTEDIEGANESSPLEEAIEYTTQSKTIK